MLNRYTLGPYCYLNDYSRQIILIHFQREEIPTSSFKQLNGGIF